jgi:hypothetical protein
MVYLDFRSLCLINCRAVHGPAPSPGQLQIYGLCGSWVPGGTCAPPAAGGGGGQVGGAFTLDDTHLPGNQGSSGVPRGDAQDARASPLPPCASPPLAMCIPPLPSLTGWL